jgi:hypothetical protein
LYRQYADGLFLGVNGSNGDVLAGGGIMGNAAQKLGTLLDFLPTARDGLCN